MKCKSIGEFILVLIVVLTSRIGFADSFVHTTSLNLSSSLMMVERRTLATMTFSRWGDVIVADVGVGYDDRGDCTFQQASREDQSTKWYPFQIYWAIFDRMDDVRNGYQLEGFFGGSDVLSASELQKSDGCRAVGFSYLSSEGERMVDINPVRLLDNGQTLEAILTIAGRKAAIRARVKSDGQVSCSLRTEGCMGGPECFANGDFSPLGNIAVTQSVSGLPRLVTLEPTPALIRN